MKLISLPCNVVIVCLFPVMDEKKGPPRFGGSKVSEIANIFQNRAPNQKEEIFNMTKKKLNKVPSTEKIDDPSSPVVSVMRTESHVTRFNNARAMFEKLGCDDQHRPVKAVPLQGTKSASNILDRSRSSSANSETRETKSQYSRSPSPTRFGNGLSNDNREEVAKTNGNENRERGRPALMKKPEKPERKFNNKELIERQKNWTSHFSKTRSSRYNSDPNKSEVKFGVSSRDNSEVDSRSGASRSASFNNSRYVIGELLRATHKFCLLAGLSVPPPLHLPNHQSEQKRPNVPI